MKEKITECAAAITRHAGHEGLCQTVIPELELYGFSRPPSPESVLCEPSLTDICVPSFDARIL